MPKEVKFTEDELKQVQTIQRSYSSVQNQFKQKSKNFLMELLKNTDK